MTINAIPWWTESVDEIARHIDSSSKGLTIAEAAARLKRHGPNALKVDASPWALSLLLRQLSSPIVLILIAAAILSFAMNDATDGLIILFIVAASAALGFSQEFHAALPSAGTDTVNGLGGADYFNRSGGHDECLRR